MSTSTSNVQVPRLRYPLDSTVITGDRLGTIRQIDAGAGTHVQGGHVYASLVGKLTMTEKDAEMDTGEPSESTFVCSVLPTNKTAASSHVLRVGQLVVGKVLRITPQNALVEIQVAEGVGPLESTIPEGAIRMEDVRGGASEQVKLWDCFQPNDLVVARIHSLGDARRYFLTTAETQLGVLKATSKTSGLPMVPLSWNEMACPETGAKERRKCAKPPQL